MGCLYHTTHHRATGATLRSCSSYLVGEKSIRDRRDLHEGMFREDGRQMQLALLGNLGGLLRWAIRSRASLRRESGRHPRCPDSFKLIIAGERTTGFPSRGYKGTRWRLTEPACGSSTVRGRAPTGPEARRARPPDGRRGSQGRARAMAALTAPLNDRRASRSPPESVAKVAQTSGSRVLIPRPVGRTLPLAGRGVPRRHDRLRRRHLEFHEALGAHDRGHRGPPGVGRVAAGPLLPHTPRGTPTPRACRPSEQNTLRRATRE